LSAESAHGALIFFSYARPDKILRDRLEIHLSYLKYRGLITSWHDQQIRAGDQPVEQITINLHKANIILLLISPSFMASDYCYSTQMQQAIQRHTLQEADVIPILLRPVLFTGAPFAELAMLPSNGKPVASWRDRDSAFVNIAYGIEKVAHKYIQTSHVFRGSEKVLTDFSQLPVEEATLKTRYYQEMLYVYDLVLRHSPFDSTALCGKGNALYELARYEEAHKIFLEALQHTPSASAYAGLGNTYTALQRHSEAVTAFEQAWALDPTLTLPFHNLIQSLSALERMHDVDLLHQKIVSLGYEEDE
jgi:tetratricopeptide (TPR) repeat protein